MKAAKFLGESLIALLVALGGFQVVLAESDNQEVYLDKIVVTSNRYSQNVSDIPAGVSVVTQGDIEDSSADTITEALRGIPDLVVNDFYGNGSKALVDLRGFGDMAMMNTLVLLDGRRINEVDMSGVDWTQIPLEQIKKIEIIRGGGSVLYGENAVGGVINIITKSGEGKPKFKIGGEIGSYDKHVETFSLSGSHKDLSYSLNSSWENNNSYRNNSFFKTYDYGSKFEYDFSEWLSAHFSSGFHRATYGLPGGLSDTDISNFNRRYSKYGDDRATDKDYYFMAGTENDIGNLGEFSFDLSYRVKDVNSNLIGGNGGWNPIRINHITTFGFTPKVTIDKELLGHKNLFITGIDMYRSAYNSDQFDSASAMANTTSINKYSLGEYFEEKFYLTDKLSAEAGFRYESAKYSFNFHDNTGWSSDVDTWKKPNKKAFNAGLNYKYKDESNVYFNINQSYRFPATDEFFDGSTLNTALKPQTSVDYEAGVRHDFGKRLHVEVSGYRMNINDELFTDPTAFSGLGATSNYDKTIHQGGDVAARFKFSDTLSVYANYSYQNAKFYKTHLGGNLIPWVPEHKTSFGVKFNFLKDFTLNANAYYVGSRYRINDVTNALPKVKGYFTTDLGLIYKHRDFTVSGNINNLFNAYYYEFATYGSYSGNKLYYPAPGRNFSLKMDYNF